MESEHDYNFLPDWLQRQMDETSDPRLKTREGIARAVNKSRTTVYNWFDSKDLSRPRPETAAHLERIFGRPTGEALSTYVSRRPGRKKGS